MTIAPELLRRIVEGALLAAGQPLSEDKLLSLIDEGERPAKAELRTLLEEIAESCKERGFELKRVASGWRFQVPEDLAPWVNRLWEEKPQKYSRAILETLAIIAYRQPITRGDIEEIRGVAVSSHIIRTLTERGWIKVVGHRDVPGKPALYATTKEFLDYFNLRTLDDLPTLAEIRDIESISRELSSEAERSDSDAQEKSSDEGPDKEAAEAVEPSAPDAVEDGTEGEGVKNECETAAGETAAESPTEDGSPVSDDLPDDRPADADNVTGAEEQLAAGSTRSTEETERETPEELQVENTTL